MEINTLGLTAAVTAFMSIWLGHVAVRKIEAVSPNIWLPTSIFVALGISVEYLSLVLRNTHHATLLGILGITLLWDAFEIYRQQNRVKHGHAPANPNNPRHVRILAEYPSATTKDLLKREPTGKPITNL